MEKVLGPCQHRMLERCLASVMIRVEIPNSATQGQWVVTHRRLDANIFRFNYSGVSHSGSRKQRYVELDQERGTEDW